MKKVQYEEMLPHELAAALEEFPVAYVPVGSLEWHGRHLPLGNDAMKAHAICVCAAQKSGGVVVPPTFWGHMGHWKPGCHPGLSPEVVDKLYTQIYEGLVTVGFKVVIGVTGHDVNQQVESLQKGADALAAGGNAAGFAMMEGSLHPDDPDVGMDHAAKWETSYMMFFRPELVDMARIAEEDLESDEGRAEAGIGGLDPREHASAKVGETAVEKMADAIGRKAQQLLDGLTE